MRREFVPFDPATIAKELDNLPATDANKLTALVTHYEKCGVGNPSPAKLMTMVMESFDFVISSLHTKAE